MDLFSSIPFRFSTSISLLVLVASMVISVKQAHAVRPGVSLAGVGSSDVPHWATSQQRKILQSTAIEPNVVVALDGTGKYRSIQDALHEVPAHGKQQFIIYIKEGLYKERFNITETMTNLVFIGDGATKTKITYNQGYTDKIQTYATATVGIDAAGFMARDIGFENTAGPEARQAVALRVSGDMCIFYRIQIDGFQDSLYAHRRRQFYRECRISGTVDFIFGAAVALFQNCQIIVRRPMKGQQNMVLASGKESEKDQSALILQNCSIQADPLLSPDRFTIKSYLGRPWKLLATHIVMYTEIGDLIDPTGWSPWDNTTFALDTCFFAEFNNTGLGSNLSQRANWTGVKTGKLLPEEFNQFTATSELMKGGGFIVDSGVPCTPGLVD